MGTLPQPPVPQAIIHAVPIIHQNGSQIATVPVSTTVETSVQDPSKSTTVSSSVNTLPLQATSVANPPIQTAAGNITSGAALPLGN